VPIAAGLVFLSASGGFWFLWILFPGALLLATGVGLLLWPGDRRLVEFMALGGVLGAVAALPVLLGSFHLGLAALLLAAASFLAAGSADLVHEPVEEGIPEPTRTISMAAKVALDDAVIAYFVGSAKLPSGRAAEEAARASLALEKTIEQSGWLREPTAFHDAPPPPDAPAIEAARVRSLDYERLTYESGFVPRRELPGAESWSGYDRNSRAVAWMLRHRDKRRRPWLLGIHGYRMGMPWLDFLLFSPRWLHQRLGLNVLMPVLPLHGPRRIGLRSGDLFLDGNPVNLLFSEAQAVWDLRRAIAWIRQQDPGASIGVLGFSLGGYNAALLAGFESDLAFAIAGIPAVDFAALLWRNLPPGYKRYFDQQGMGLEHRRRLLSVVSPLAIAPRIAADRRYIFAGVADRLVPPEEPMRLAAHWGVPVEWYQGAHLSFRGEPGVTAHIEAAMRRAGWLAS